MKLILGRDIFKHFSLLSFFKRRLTFLGKTILFHPNFGTQFNNDNSKMLNAHVDIAKKH